MTDKDGSLSKITFFAQHRKIQQISGKSRKTA